MFNIDESIEFFNMKKYIINDEIELWDLYDSNRNKLNKDHIRGVKLNEGEYHLVVHVWIKNQNGQYLMSKRSAIKKFPFMWECPGGSVLKGETTYDGGIREVKEEVGVDLSNISGRFITSIKRDEYQDIVDVYEFIYNGPVSLKQATTNEVDEIKWMTKEEIKKYFEEGKLLHTMEYFLSKFLNLKESINM